MPQRFLKPGIVSSKKWDGLPWIAQSFYVRIITLVDDYGRHLADPVLLKNQAFPLREDIRAAQVLELCTQLASAQLALFYKVDGKEYLEITNWTERARAKRSFYPAPEQGKPYLTANVVTLTADVVNPQPPTSPSSPSTSPPPKSSTSPPPPPLPANVVEPDPSFPRTEEMAVKKAPLRFQEQQEFVITTFHKANGRGGRDAKDVLIRNWASHLAIEWKYRQERESQQGHGNAAVKPNAQHGAPIWQQIKSTEVLIAEVGKKLDGMPLPNEALDPRGYDVVKKKRVPLIEQRKRLQAQLLELHKRVAPGGGQ